MSDSEERSVVTGKTTSDSFERLRLRQRDEILRQGENPYPHFVAVSHSIKKIVESNLPNITTAGQVATAGRVKVIRRHGGSTFADLVDGDCRVQAYFQEDTLGQRYPHFCDNVNRGDFLWVKGQLFQTRARKQLTLKVSDFSLIAKALKDPPIVWIDQDGKEHGSFSNPDERYRKRYLDLMVNPQSRKVFLTKASIVRETRRFLEDREFVDLCGTPVLQPLYGGANARPFKTFVNDLKEEWYLRISPELYLKRMIVGGIGRVYEIGQQFRNEGIDSTHNPEFLSLELYETYADYNTMMELTESLVSTLARKVLGTTSIKYGNDVIRLDPPWRRISMYDAIRQYAKVDVERMTDEEIIAFAGKDHSEAREQFNRGLVVAEIFEASCERHLIQPTFVVDYPKETSPLCKHHRTNPDLIERFELYIGGMELANAYTELNDPVIQEQLMREQIGNRGLGDEDAQRYDEDFIEALAYGMPPTGGLGIGIDRLVMILTGRESIKDVILFPMVKRANPSYQMKDEEH